jgi:hypothetical protein
MANASYPSGEWVGFYTYRGKITKCPMHLTLNFAEGKIRGAGLDNPGQFVIEGSYDPAGTRLEWLKQYIGKHGVLYQGTSQGDEIAGVWTLQKANQGSGSGTGEFRLWPLPDGEYPGDERLQTILVKEILRKGYL